MLPASYSFRSPVTITTCASVLPGLPCAPALASRKVGEAFLEFMVERIPPDVRRFLDGERVPGMSLRTRFLLRLLSTFGRVREAFA
ncbi:MAG: hypothetical protein HYY17_13770 [Planctomycetes bacterium]|nr:hypothetical protein [Planctomycetota bacterium]